jgi:hypothetical protein
MRRLLGTTIPVAALAIATAIGLGDAAAAEGIEGSRTDVRTVRRSHTGPELSDLDAEHEDLPGTSGDENDGERAKPDQGGSEQKQRAPRTGGAGACMYGPDGGLIYAPPGRQCGVAASAH